MTKNGTIDLTTAQSVLETLLNYTYRDLIDLGVDTAEIDGWIDGDVTKMFKSLNMDDPDPEPLEVIDAFIDMFYYCMDTCAQYGIPTHNFVNQVKQFTFPARNLTTPLIDRSKESYVFLSKMVLSEIVEGLVALKVKPKYNPVDLKMYSIDVIGLVVFSVSIVLPNEILEAAFNEVHSANMRKGKMIDGVLTFEKQVHNGVEKIIKPAGWVGPDLKKVDVVREFAGLE